MVGDLTGHNGAQWELRRAGQVSGPTSPSTPRPLARWNFSTAALVSVPKSPSTPEGPTL